jgi:hypothetical protein
MNAPQIDIDAINTSNFLNTGGTVGGILFVVAVVGFGIAFLLFSADIHPAFFLVAALVGVFALGGVFFSVGANADAHRHETQSVSKHNVKIIKAGFPEVTDPEAAESCIKSIAGDHKNSCTTKMLNGDLAQEVKFEQYGDKIIYTVKSKRVGS